MRLRTRPEEQCTGSELCLYFRCRPRGFASLVSQNRCRHTQLLCRVVAPNSGYCALRAVSDPGAATGVAFQHMEPSLALYFVESPKAEP